MSVSMSIGPSGLPPSTTYSFDAGFVTLSARPATQRTASELASIVRSIRTFRMAVVGNDNPAIGNPGPPLTFRWVIEAAEPGISVCRYRCAATGAQTLTIDATQNLITRITTFEDRPERTITWGDFDLLLRWMTLLSDLANR